MHIIGTAGHVDHGKSALVRALTGTDPDRFAEEQRRGMTLDLGFAHLAFADGIEAGIIDVPGHERFLHNMLAGAAGMELVLLVVAANEGAKPQTLEHLAILAYLNVRQTLIVLTKSDIVDAHELASAQRTLRADLRGTPAHDAPIYPVSTLTGEGLDALRHAIHAALEALPERAPNAPAYLPIDRVFARVGHGTVVTGTLMQGAIAVGDTLALTPLGRSVRVRGLQVFGQKRERVTGGTRVAVNLPGVEIAELARGAVLGSPQLEVASSLRVHFRPLPAAIALLRRRTPVRAYMGSAETLGTLVFEQVPTRPDNVEARLYLRTPSTVIPHAPFVVRRVSPMNLLGGGTIAGGGIAGDDALDTADERERDGVVGAVVAASLAGATLAQIGAAANLDASRVTQRLAELVADNRVRAVAKPPAYIAAELADDIFARAVERLTQRQRERPWLMGSTSIALAQAIAIPEAALVRVLATFVESGALAYRGGYYATRDFTPQLTPEQRAFFDREFGPGAQATATSPLVFEEFIGRIRASPVTELAAAFETLVAGGEIAKVGDFVYTSTQIGAIRLRLETELRRTGQITAAEFRTLTGTSRKYAIPLLEFFDATGVTIRTGDVRVLRRITNRPAAESGTSPAR